MKRYLSFFVFLVSLHAAPQEIPLIRGEVKYSGSLIHNHLTVELVDASSHQVTGRELVGNDGSFEFRNVPAGRYEVRVNTQFGDTLARAGVDTAPMAPVTLTIPETPRTAAPAGTISVARLRHKAPKKARQAMAAAQRNAARGQSAAAAEELRKAIRIDPDYPEAHTNLGVQLLRANRAEAAVEEFRRAIELDPATASYYSNLAFALMAAGRYPDALEPADRAVRMEGSNVRAHWVLGYLLARWPEKRHQAIAHLRIAAREMPHAHYVLAQLLHLSGDDTGAREEIDRYAAAIPGLNPRDIEKWKSGVR